MRTVELAPSMMLTALSFASPAHGESMCPKIDVHQHAHSVRVYTVNPLGPNKELRVLCVNDRVPCANAPSQFVTDEQVLQGTLEYMRRYDIVRAYVSTDDERQLQKWVEAAPERFVAGISFDDPGSAPPIDKLREAFGRMEYGLLGEVGSQYAGLPPNHPALEPYFRLAEELDLPVSIHTEGIGARVPSFRVAAGDPLLLEEVLVAHPSLRVYVENAGYPFGDQMIAMLYMYPRLYADLSTIAWLVPREAFHDYLRRLTRAGFADRLMFGSDQMAWPETIGMAVEAIESADFLTAEEKCNIFFNNAVRFFRLDGEALRRAGWR
jgi:uncharacterized protein